MIEYKSFFIYFKCYFFIGSLASPKMEFFRLTMDISIFSANYLRSSNFYKSKGKIETDKLQTVI